MTTSISPVGVWSGVVAFDDRRQEFTISFATDGSIALRTSISRGTGSWVWAGPQRFTYTLDETFTAEAPMAGGVTVNVDATVEAATYAGTGTAKIHAADGAVVHSTSARFTADRADDRPAEWHRPR